MSVKVTVLVPSLNVVKYIKQCMDSIVNQTLKQIEIICIDAGSTDGTLEILETYAKNDPRIKLIHSDKKSYGYQMNLGLSLAKGQYIGIVETDDFIELDMYQDLFYAASQLRADLMFGGYFSYNTQKKTNDPVKVSYKTTSIRMITAEEKKALLLATPSIWRAIYKREYLLQKKIDFLETPGASYQDAGFWAKAIIATESIAVTPNNYYHYRIDNDNSSVRSKGKVFCVCDEMNSVFQYVTENNLETPELISSLWYDKYLRYCWNARRLDKEQAMSFLNRMQCEFLDAKDGGVLERKELQHLRRRIELLLSEPEVFLNILHEKDFDEFTIEEDTVCLKAKLFLLQEENDALIRENGHLKEDIKSIQNSISFRIGRTIVFIPKKLRMMLKKEDIK